MRVARRLSALALVVAAACSSPQSDRRVDDERWNMVGWLLVKEGKREIDECAAALRPIDVEIQSLKSQMAAREWPTDELRTSATVEMRALSDSSATARQTLQQILDLLKRLSSESSDRLQHHLDDFHELVELGKGLERSRDEMAASLEKLQSVIARAQDASKQAAVQDGGH